MKQSEITKCVGCGEGVGHNSDIAFYRVSAQYMVLDMQAVSRAHGMEMVMGGGSTGAMLQQVMGPNEDLANEVSSHDVCICLKCAMERTLAEMLMESEQ